MDRLKDFIETNKIDFELEGVIPNGFDIEKHSKGLFLKAKMKNYIKKAVSI